MYLKKNKNLNDDFDLLEAFLFFFYNKIKIILFVIASTIAMYFYVTISKSTFAVTTFVKPISPNQEFHFDTYNALDRSNMALPFRKITRGYLLGLFIEKLNEGKIFEDAIKELSLVNRDDYASDKIYNDAVRSLANSITLLPPTIDLTRQINEPYWRIRFSSNNKKNSFKLLQKIEDLTNQSIREYLKDSFLRTVRAEEKIMIYQLEDIDLKILGALAGYEKSTKNRLVFLKEQASIARKLEIAKNTLPFQNFNSETAVITDLQSTEIPYYTKGFEMIEKEIELINNRKDKKAFIDVITQLELEKENIISNRNLKRIKMLFEEELTVLFKKNFNLANIKFYSSKYTVSKMSASQKILIAAIFSSIVGSIYVLLIQAIRNRKKN